MKGLTHRAPLRLRLSRPLRCAVVVDARRCSAGPSRHAVQDRSVERRVDDVAVGHVRPLFNTPNIAEAGRNVSFDRQQILNGKAA